MRTRPLIASPPWTAKDDGSIPPGRGDQHRHDRIPVVTQSVRSPPPSSQIRDIIARRSQGQKT